MRKFSKILENKDLSYKDFFGKEVSHIESLKDSVISHIIEIIRSENNVSEKSFSEYDKIIKSVKDNFNNDMLEKSKILYNQGKRIEYISEILYDENFS
jgi:phosphopantothenoylcysteine synthetase/decarboxylase